MKEATWNDVTQDELELLDRLGVVDIGEGEELKKGGFILLGLLRMGQVSHNEFQQENRSPYQFAQTIVYILFFSRISV